MEQPRIPSACFWKRKAQQQIQLRSLEGEGRDTNGLESNTRITPAWIVHEKVMFCNWVHRPSKRVTCLRRRASQSSTKRITTERFLRDGTRHKEHCINPRARNTETRSTTYLNRLWAAVSRWLVQSWTSGPNTVSVNLLRAADKAGSAIQGVQYNSKA